MKVWIVPPEKKAPRKETPLSGIILLIGLILVLMGFVLPGCCWMSKRSCFPACPKPPVKVVAIEKPCQLPGPLKLPRVARVPCSADSGEKMVCYDLPNAARLAERESAMKGWIRDVRARCSPTSQPTSRPAP